MLDKIAPALIALEPRGLSMQIDDDDSDVPVPLPAPADEPQPGALVSIWLDRYDDRAPYEAVLRSVSDDIAGYLVTESLYTDYGGNQWSPPRNWENGERSPGVVMVTLLRKPTKMADDDWFAHWHDVQSPVSEAMQPRTCYRRNTIARSITPNAPNLRGIVEEAWPSAEHITDPALFYNAKTPEEVNANLTSMLGSVTAFLDLSELRSFTTSEYLIL
ncbi:MAG: hypothetical protein EXQ69_07855 [Acidimicrobiia bacterium]|nr:hypothetical protein [Acidimicrobiia bacterium]